MDERLSKALEFSNYMVTLNNQKRILHEQYKQDLVYYYKGGQFSVTQELISFCQSLNNLGQTETVLIDDNRQPIQIESLEDFLLDIVNTYSDASNKYLTEYDNIKKNRSVEGLVEHE
jgi:hypothetical protein